jgi:hypothetical protein
VVIGQPADPRILAEPGLLPACKLPGTDHGQISSLRFTDFAVEIPQHLPIPERPRGGEAGAKAGFLEPSYFIDEAGGPHRLHPGGNPRVERWTIDCDADLHNIGESISVLRQYGRE